MTQKQSSWRVAVSAGALLVVIAGGALIWSMKKAGDVRRKPVTVQIAASDPSTAAPQASVYAPAVPLSSSEQEELRYARLPVREQMQATLDRLAVELRSTLRDEARFPELARCIADKRECPELFSQALDHSVAWPVWPMIANGRGGIRQLQIDHGVESAGQAAQEVLLATLSGSSDPVMRLTALLSYERLAPECATACAGLPASAYDGLAEAPPVEAKALLRAYQHAPPAEQSLIENVGTLARTTDDEGVRSASLLALGASKAQAQLEDAMTAMVQTGGLQENEQRALGPALAHCGGDCKSLFESMLNGSDATQRQVALVAAALLRDRSLGRALVEQMPATAKKSLTAKEADQLAFLSEGDQ
jgi:hypothetical protein